MEKIDFVLTWVDEKDEKWKKEKRKIENLINPNKLSNSNNRFRDWDNLKYWFRGVEKYANWVNKIFFITYGHLPNWLNTNHSKLKIVKHSDYIPTEYLPTYNSNTILLNLYRIKDLSENFVVFNDDMFITKNVKQKDFFINNLPCDEFSFDLIAPIGKKEIFFHMLLNNIDIINKHFNKKDIIRNNFFNIFNIKNKKIL